MDVEPKDIDALKSSASNEKLAPRAGARDQSARSGNRMERNPSAAGSWIGRIHHQKVIIGKLQLSITVNRIHAISLRRSPLTSRRG